MAAAESNENLESSRVYLVEDDPILAKGQQLRLNRGGFETEVFHSGETALEALQKGDLPHAVVLDLLMPGIGGMETLKRIRQYDPDLPVVVVSGQDKVSTAVETLRQGAYDYMIKPVNEETLIATVRHATAQRRVSMELARLRQEVRRAFTFDRLIGRSSAMRRVFKLIERTLTNDITVLVLGESGTGKELVARAIHYNGLRAGKPLVVVNCAAIPRELVESELFGHEKGAFTGALERKIGKFEMASGGTLFLDEIGELELSVQAKLLRAIQEREIERVGGGKPIPVNVRLICATQRDLEKEVAADNFREDLFYRINAFPITMPPLREREGDIELLIGHLLDKHAKPLAREDIRGFSPSAVAAMRAFDWPGNVRQLENVITRAMVLSETDVISLYDLPANIQECLPEGMDEDAEEPPELELETDSLAMEAAPSHILDPDEPQPEGGLPRFRRAEDVPSLEEVKAWAIREAFEACKHNVSLTAKKLELGRATLYRMLEKYGISSTTQDD